MKVELRNFLEEYLRWAELDAPKGIFDPLFGLCLNLEIWCQHMGYDSRFTEILKKSMENLLTATCLHKGYPFGGITKYLVDQGKKSHHKNPKRIAWIKAQVGKQ